MSSAEGGVLRKIGRVWNNFWFTPADPTPLALMRYVTDTLTDEEKKFCPEPLLKVPVAARPTARDELRQFWDVLPRDDRGRTYVLAALGEIYGIEPWKNFMTFLDDLPADPAR